jgi:hypothetical protein
VEGFLSKCISIILVFFLLIIAPMINIYGQHEMQGRMEILNDVTAFLDRVTDKGEITQDDIDEFTLTVESHGLVLDVDIDRLVKTATLIDASTEELDITYIAADDITKLSSGNVVKVSVKEISTTRFKKLLNIFLKFNEPNFELTMSKMVR